MTFADNALLKARSAAARPPGCRPSPTTRGCASTCSAGARHLLGPLVRAGTATTRANLELLLAQLADVPDEHRGARPSSARRRWPCRTVASGCVEGRLPGRADPGAARDRRLRLRPDPAVDGDGRTAAELTPAEKNAITHRGQAFRALGPDLREALAGVRNP